MNSTPITLYFRREPLETPLTLGSLRANLPEHLVWISLEPYPQLPERNGKRLRGPIPELAPLTTHLPDPQWDDLPLATATLFGSRSWTLLVAPQPLSGQSGMRLTWQLDEAPLFEAITGITVHRQPVLPWQDRDRFGRQNDSALALPQKLTVEHFYQAGRRITWRLVPGNGQTQGVSQ